MERRSKGVPKKRVSTTGLWFNKAKFGDNRKGHPVEKEELALLDNSAGGKTCRGQHLGGCKQLPQGFRREIYHLLRM